MYTLVRMGNGTKAVDNISSGGMYAPVDENGVIFKPLSAIRPASFTKFIPLPKPSWWVSKFRFTPRR